MDYHINQYTRATGCFEIDQNQISKTQHLMQKFCFMILFRIKFTSAVTSTSAVASTSTVASYTAYLVSLLNSCLMHVRQGLD